MTEGTGTASGRRRAIVSGGSTGIGRAVVLQLTAAGVDVLATGRDRARLDALRAGVAGPGSVETVVADLGTAEGAAAVLDRAHTLLGGADIVVNNLGLSESRAFHAATDDDWHRALEVNLMAAVRLTRGCIAGMRDRHWGRLVHIASVVARQPDPFLPAYSAAKAALVSLSKSLALAYGRDGITSNCVLPGVTETSMLRHSVEQAGARAGLSGEQVLERLLQRDPIPLGRIGTPEDIASAVCFLVGEQASWITGACIAVDGGSLRGV